MPKPITTQESKYNSARYTILMVFILSLVNIGLLFIDYYLIFSARLSLLFAAEGVLTYLENQDSTYLIVSIVLALITLVPYLICFIFSKKHYGWMIAALCLISADTLLLVIDLPAYLAAGDTTIFIDLAVHVVIIVECAIGLKAGIAIKKKKEADAVDTLLHTEEVKTESDNDAILNRTITITRKKCYIGFAMPMKVYVGDTELFSLKNGETKSATVTGKSFELSAVCGVACVGEITVEAGETNVTYCTDMIEKPQEVE